MAVQMVEDLTPQQRAIIIYSELKAKGEISNSRARELTGLSLRRVSYLLSVVLCALLDLNYDEKRKVWYINE